MKIIVDRPRAEALMTELVGRYLAHLYPYNTGAAVLPQEHDNLPATLPRGGVEHANFLFHLCYHMRGVIDSVSAVKRYGNLYLMQPDWFNPAVAKDLSYQQLRSWLYAGRLPAVEVTIKTWQTNAARLHERWGGDPRRIFDGVDTYGEACRRIQNKRGEGFMGFQEKMVSMIIYFLTCEDMITPLPHPPPVDFHVMRLMIEHEIMTFPDTPLDVSVHSKDLEAACRELLSEFCQRHHVDPLDLCSALWVYSRTMCQYNPANESNIERTDYDTQRLGRKRTVDAAPVTWSNEQLLNYARSCGRCTVRSTCRWNIPAGPYYIRGALVRRGERPTPDQLEIFDTVDLATNWKKVAKPAPSPRPATDPPLSLFD